MSEFDIWDELDDSESVLNYQQAGSSYYLSLDPILTKDLDIIVQVTDTHFLKDLGFVKRKSYYNGSECWRRDKIDLIVVRGVNHFIKWCAAAALCKELRLSDKDTIIKIFNTVV